MTPSIEDLQGFLEDSRERHQQADAASSPLQKSISWGDHVICRDPTTGFFIFSKLHTREEMITEETEGFDEVTAEAVTKEIDLRFEDNLRFGKWFSDFDEYGREGEYGSKHVVSLWPITEEDFEAAKANNWNPSVALIERIAAEVEEEDFEPPKVEAMFVIDPGDDIQIARLATLFVEHDELRGSDALACSVVHGILKKVFRAYRDELLEEETDADT